MWRNQTMTKKKLVKLYDDKKTYVITKVKKNREIARCKMFGRNICLLCGKITPGFFAASEHFIFTVSSDIVHFASCNFTIFFSLLQV